MITIISEKVARIIKNRKRLEKKLKVKITNRGKEVSVSGDAPEEEIAREVLSALNFGFPFSVALLIKEQDFVFEVLNIKNYTHSKNLRRIRARIIGRDGTVLKTLSQLTEGYFELKDNRLGIIADAKNIEESINAAISIIRGAKQAKVYGFLERHKTGPISDLGLRENETN